jgi:serine/threonine protein kinase
MSKGRIVGGRYRLEQRLGRGNFGVVWRADELLSGEPVATVAVKVFTAEVDRREISLLAGVSHPSILAYRAVVEDDGEVCLVTELADGGDAAARLRAWPDGLPASEVKEIVGSVAAALGHLHTQGWVHRDVKPANILFVKGTPKLGDVGTARALESTARATSTASLAYAAPEVFSGKYSPAVDVYALACTVYELLTGRLPFEGTMTELVHKHLTSEIEFPTDMPSSFVEMIRVCTQKEPERRWPVERISTWASADDAPTVAPHQGSQASTTGQGTPTQAAPSAAFAEAWASKRGQAGTATSPPTNASATASRASEAKQPAAPPTSSQAVTPPPTPEPARNQAAPPPKPAGRKHGRTDKPTPLDPALRRHLRHHGERWSDSNVWKSFMRTAAPTAKQHGLSERDLIRRASQLLPEVRAGRLNEQETIARVGAWVTAQPGGRWSALDWADFLDQINAHDEDAVARIRDVLVARLHPPAAGATRVLDLGSGVQHLLVYAPLSKLYRPTTKVFDAFRNQPASNIEGVWYSAKPITIREWSTIAATPAPPNLQPESTALANADIAEAMLNNLRRRFPIDELRWPAVFEYDGMKWHREQLAQREMSKKELMQRTAKAGALLAQQDRRRAQARRPKTLGGLLAQTAGTAAVNMLKEIGETWLSASGTNKQPRNKRLAMNLVSPVPKRG